MRYPVTPDGRYFVVRGRLWRCTNPGLNQDERGQLTRELMQARAAVGRAKRAGDEERVRIARTAVNRAKVALGERGAVWWTDGARITTGTWRATPRTGSGSRGYRTSRQVRKKAEGESACGPATKNACWGGDTVLAQRITD